MAITLSLRGRVYAGTTAPPITQATIIVILRPVKDDSQPIVVLQGVDPNWPTTVTTVTCVGDIPNWSLRNVE